MYQLQNSHGSQVGPARAEPFQRPGREEGRPMYLQMHPANRIHGGGAGSAERKEQPAVPKLQVGQPSYQPSTSSTSNLTEFTKRKNWSQRIVDDIQDFMHVTSLSGNFLFCSPSIYQLAGYKAEDLLGSSLYDYVHPEDLDNLKKGYKKAIETGGHFVLYFRFRKKDGGQLVLESTGHPYFSSKPSPTSSAAPSSKLNASGDEMETGPKTGYSSGSNEFCRCLFSIARPYPSKNVSLLDSFLELKMENERLRSTLKELYSKNQASVIESLKAQRQAVGDGSDSSEDEYKDLSLPDEVARPLGSVEDVKGKKSHLNHERSKSGSTETRHFNVKPAVALPPPSAPSTRPSATSSSQDKQPPATSEPSSRPAGGVYTIPIAPARTSTTVDDHRKDTADVPRSAQPASAADLARSRKKKKARSEEEDYVCTDCGTVDSPEWRKGPLGSKTLCNACGLRWAKKAKKGSLAAGLGGTGGGGGGLDDGAVVPGP